MTIEQVLGLRKKVLLESLMALRVELAVLPGLRREFCHSAAPSPLHLVGVSIRMERECQHNDSLTDG